MKIYQKVLKSVFDVTASLILLVVFSPLILVTCVLLFWANKGYIFFLQPRPGRFGRVFKIIKLKTMRDAFDENGNPLPDHLRITSIGRLVRSASLDELLQLLNVIKGDMSLVGPRPLLVEYLDLYTSAQSRRHEVKPGITGWAQVNGRNAISWEEKFKYDIWYVENLTFSLDCKIILMTFLKVFRTQDINQQGSASAEKFTGN